MNISLPENMEYDEKTHTLTVRTVNPEPTPNTSVSIGKSSDVDMAGAIELEGGDLVNFEAKESKA